MTDIPKPPLITLAQAARQLEVEAKTLGNTARQHGFFTAVGRDLYFTEAQLSQIRALLRDRDRAEKKAASRRRKPHSTFGMNESTELRKQRRRDKKRQVKKDDE